MATAKNPRRSAPGHFQADSRTNGCVLEQLGSPLVAHTTLEDADAAFHQREYEPLRFELQAAHDASQLPELPSDETRKALNDLLVGVRVKRFN